MTEEVVRAAHTSHSSKGLTLAHACPTLRHDDEAEIKGQLTHGGGGHQFYCGRVQHPRYNAVTDQKERCSERNRGDGDMAEARQGGVGGDGAGAGGGRAQWHGKA